MADKAVIACKAGFAEGVEEVSSFIEMSMPARRRGECEIFLVNAPQIWTLAEARRLFKHAQCVDGDPFACPVPHRNKRQLQR